MRRHALQLSYSARLMQPFLELLASHPHIPPDVLEPLRKLDLDARIPIGDAHAQLDLAVRATRDPLLGLKAGRTMVLGDAGVCDYAISTASTVGEGVEIAMRYARLVNEALDVQLEPRDERVLIRMASRVELSRAAEDFLLSAGFAHHIRVPLQDAPNLECWLMHEAPEDASEYVRTFAPARVRFGASCSGFVFDRMHLSQPLSSSDPKLRPLVRQLAERMLAELPATDTVTDRVRRLIAGELPQGDPSSTRAASLLHMSQRTLCRRLEQEGTSYRELLDELRRQLALQYLTRRDLSVSEIAFLLGFSQAAAFHRAFKRWTGRTPLDHRRSSSS
jgi:AraC-like DNA-binding protein